MKDAMLGPGVEKFKVEERLMYRPSFSAERLAYDVKNFHDPKKFSEFWSEKKTYPLPPEIAASGLPLWLEIGAGTGWFFTELAHHYPEKFLLAFERSRIRGRRLVHKTKKAGLSNLIGLRGNAIGSLVKEIPDASVEKLFILYPCPWPKNSQRKHRWYLHPLMAHLVRVLVPGGTIVWASDQEFYIEEAKWVSENVFGLETLKSGVISPHAENHLEKFPEGRTGFERNFSQHGWPCYELISQKVSI